MSLAFLLNSEILSFPSLCTFLFNPKRRLRGGISAQLVTERTPLLINYGITRLSSSILYILGSVLSS